MAARSAIYLLADSQLLFWRDGDSLFLESIRRAGLASPRAAYLGASNGDRLEFYRLFESAMDQIGVTDRRMIRSTFPPDDAAFLAQADIILLAGGDPDAGWHVITSTGMREILARRHAEGATLLGVSAGAMHLGAYGWTEREAATPADVWPALACCPFAVSSHDEQRDWQSLTATVASLRGVANGLAIRSGGGVIYHADGSLQAVRYPAQEFLWIDNAVQRRGVPVSTPSSLPHAR